MRLASLMAAVVAAGGSRLDLGITWLPPIWVGRPRRPSRRVTKPVTRSKPAKRRSRSRWNA